MLRNPFRIISKSFLGIDIGVFLVKAIELSQWGGGIALKNYSQIKTSALYQKPFKVFEKGTFLLSTPDVSKIIVALLEEAKIKTKEVTFTIPDFSSFLTSFELPPMPEEEIPEAVNFEARRHIPVPVSEVVLDWFLTESKIRAKERKLKILLVAVPNEVVERYQKIAQASRLELKYLEVEIFSLIRALVRDQKEAICLLEIGAQSTTVNVVDEGILKLSHSFDIAGNELTHTIGKCLAVDSSRAEFLKKKGGLESEEMKEILLPLINFIIIEMERIFKDFSRTQAKEIQKIIIAGGSANLPGLSQYLSSHFKKQAVIANPFSNISYPSILEKKLKKIGPSSAVAVGAALRGLQ